MLSGCTVIPCTAAADVFARLLAGSVAAAVIPIENALAGTVAEHQDLLLDQPVFIQREYLLRIRHHLIAPPGVRLRDVRRVYSHPVALEQCRRFLRAHPRLEALPFYDTAGAVRRLMREGARDAAAIAGRQAAREYGARVLRSGLEDDKRNFTRFLLLRRGRHVLPGADKTSIAFALRNVPGVLHGALGVFAARGIDLSRIESRPARGRPWEYVFFVDFLRGRDRDSTAALRELEQRARFVRVLGIYPAA